MQYRREIDGLRAVAVVPVVLFHAGVTGFSGGYVGVDVFFVISGYLITTLILTDLDAGRFSVAEFYARRARRILPALATVVLFCVPFAWLWMSPTRLRQFSESIVAVGVFVSNLFFAGEEGYFASAAEEQPLLHTWSLAVEEQYYLLFPLVMLLGWRYARRWIPLVVALVALLSFAAAHLGSRVSDGGIFYLPHLRAWELLLGSLTALYLYSRPRVDGLAGGVAGLAGLALISVAVIGFDHGTSFPSAWALLPTIGTCLIILGAGSTNLVGQLLSRPTLVGIGLISYSTYLWHHPLFAFARLRSRDEPSAAVLTGLGVVAMGLAWLTWRFIENPFRDRKRLPRRRALAFGGVVTAGLLVVGLIGQWGDGFPQRLTEQQLTTHEQLAAAFDESRFDDGECRFSSSDVSNNFVERFDRCAQRYGSAVFVTGDSHGTDLYNALAVNTSRPFVVGVTQGWCRLHSGLRRCHYEDVRRFLSEREGDVAALLYTQKGSYFLEGTDRLPINAVYAQQVHDWLRGLDLDGDVLWFGPQMEPRVDLRNLNPMVHRVGPEDASRELTVLRRVDDYLRVASERLGVEYVSKMALVDYRFDRDFIIGGHYGFSDGDHWSRAGELEFGRRLLQDARVARLLGPSSVPFPES